MNGFADGGSTSEWIVGIGCEAYLLVADDVIWDRCERLTSQQFTLIGVRTAVTAAQPQSPATEAEILGEITARPDQQAACPDPVPFRWRKASVIVVSDGWRDRITIWTPIV